MLLANVIDCLIAIPGVVFIVLICLRLDRIDDIVRAIVDRDIADKLDQDQ